MKTLDGNQGNVKQSHNKICFTLTTSVKKIKLNWKIKKERLIKPSDFQKKKGGTFPFRGVFNYFGELLAVTPMVENVHPQKCSISISRGNLWIFSPLNYKLGAHSMIFTVALFVTVIIWKLAFDQVFHSTLSNCKHVFKKYHEYIYGNPLSGKSLKWRRHIDTYSYVFN